MPSGRIAIFLLIWLCWAGAVPAEEPSIVLGAEALNEDLSALDVVVVRGAEVGGAVPPRRAEPEAEPTVRGERTVREPEVMRIQIDLSYADTPGGYLYDDDRYWFDGAETRRRQRSFEILVPAPPRD